MKPKTVDEVVDSIRAEVLLSGKQIESEFIKQEITSMLIGLLGKEIVFRHDKIDHKYIISDYQEGYKKGNNDMVIKIKKKIQELIGERK
ncbi:MAG: hypothetical protein PHH73_00250 [Candidatus Rickettsiella isopodorum]|nr:hypothetical protein [Candidatus Rickettsiella isopodorum]